MPVGGNRNREGENAVDYLRKYGLTVVKNGWPIVFLPHKSKKPIGFQWQNRDISSSDVEKALRQGKEYGFGIKCGSIVGIDDDYEASETVTDEFLDAVKELKDHYFPKALWRRGRPTRAPLRVIRLANGEIAKSLNVDKLQIIGRGRQFVAYNMHPDTGEGYVWLKGKDEGIGSPVSVRYKDIPQYPKSDLEGFLQGMLLLEETFGLAPERAGEVLRQIKAGERPKHVAGLSADQRLVEKACEFIKNDPKWGWEDWNNNIMMPLYNASKGEEWGRDLAHALSVQHDLYDSDATDERWDQIAKNPADLLGWPRLNWLARQEGMPFLGPLDWDNYRVFMDRADVLNIQNDHWIMDKRFNDMFYKYKEKKATVMQTFINTRPDQVYDTVTWNSAMDPGGTTTPKGKRLWNTWRPPDWFGEPGDITPWQVTLDRVYGAKVMDIFLKRMACDVQYPQVRPQWHFLIIGKQGVGKSDSIYPIMEWAKKFDLHQSLTTPMIKSEFNSWLSKKKIITLNEIYGITTAQFDDLKDMLAGGEDTISINEKMMKRVNESIIASFYITSNHPNAVSVSRNERRLLIHHSLELSYTEGSTKYRQELKEGHAWIKKNWPKVIYYLKHRVKVEPSFVQVHPGVTDSQLEMADLTAPAHERIADSIRQAMRNYPVFQMSDVESALLKGSMSIDPNALTVPTIRKAFAYLGAFKINKGKHVKVRNGHGEESLYFWSLDPDLKNVSNSRIRELYYLVGPTEE
jgi:hypothetical protein